MALESGQEAEGAKEEALPSLADREPVSGDLGSPAGTTADPTVPMCPQDTKPHPTWVVCPVNLRLAPESLDPCTLRLLWGQRELEIQALRWAIQNGQSARHCRILQEVLGLPTTAERSSCSQEKFLQNQVRKLTLELKEQKEQAQREKEDLEERLLQTTNTLQQLEAELQTFQKSCLLRLAQSSWVGRMLRSQTGSVEVVTAETLMDSSDFSDDQTPPAGESFRLEDVDWNSIAHRYPNLFTNMESTSGHKQPRLPPLLDTWSSESPSKPTEGCHKRVEWSTLPCMGTSSSGGADSDSSSGQLGVPFRVQKKTHSDQPSKTVLAPEPSSDPDQQRFGPGPSLTGCRLKIMEVSHREKFVRILNQSSEDTADLGGLVLKQLVRDFPVCTYRFPPGTLLAPQHHITVWGEGPGSAKHRPRLSSGHQRVHLRGDSCRVTLLLSPGGEILSEHQVPRCVAPVSETFADNTDLSIDCFPLSDTTRGTLPLLSARKFFPPRKVPAPPEGAEPRTPEPLPAIPGDPAPGEDRQVRKETKVRVCRKRVDPGCPMVALSVQTTAESRYGFRFLSCPPVTADKCRRA